MRKLGQILASVAIVGVVTGCVMSNPDTAKVASQPKNSAVRNITSFTDALRCMDDLFVAYGKRDIYITTAGIPDATGKVSAGTKDMLISALNRTSIKSKAFKYVDYDTTSGDLNQLFTDMLNAGQGFTPPSYYIRGAITQLDENALDEQAGGSIATQFFDLGLTKDQVVSLVSMDMNVGHVASRTILPGVNASNSLAVVKSGTGADAGGSFQKLGLQFSLNMNRSEGLHQAVRVLVELGVLEVLGKLTEVPYWTCLQAEKTNPKILEQARDWFDAMDQKAQISFVQGRLGGLGYYRGPASGALDAATNEALGRYQSENGLIADGRVNFDTYYSLLDTKSGTVQTAAMTAPPAQVTRPAVSIAMNSDKGARPIYRVNDFLNATARVNSDAFLYCFYKDADNVIARVFPNRFEPDPFVSAGRDISIPSKAAGKFRIRFDRPASEQVACFASNREVRLPDAYKIEDLRPLPTRSLDDVASAFRAADSGVAQAVLPITVQ